MMQKMRDPRTLKWGLWAVLILVIPSFVLFYGFGDTGADSGPQGLRTFGTVTGEHGRHEISENEILAARQELTERFFYDYVMTRNQFPDASQLSLIQGALGNRRVAEYAVGMIAFDELAESADIYVSNEQITRTLREQGVTREQYEAMLRQEGLREEQWLRRARFMERTNRTQNLVASAAKVSLLELWLEYKLREDLLTASYIRVPARDLEEEVEVTEEEILAHYQANPSSYRKPEERVYRFVVLEPPTITEEFSVTEDDIQAAYDELDPGNDPSLTVISGRVFRIASGTEADRAALQAALETAARGTNLALAFADDFTGTVETRTVDLQNEANNIADELGEDVLAAMESLGQGQTSDLLEVGDRLLLVQLEEIERTKAPFDRIRPLIEARLRSAQQAEEDQIREEIIRDTMVSMMDIRRTRTSLDAIARDLNLTVNTSAVVPSSRTFITGIGGLFEFAEILRDLRVNELSPVLRADGTDNLVVMEVSQVIPSAVRPLDEVRTQVENAVRRRKAAERSGEIAEEIARRVRSGETLADLAAEFELELSTATTPFTRLQPPPTLAMAAQAIASRTLQMAEGDILVLRAGVQDFVDSHVVFRLDSKSEPSREQFIDDIASLEAQLQRAKGEMFVDEFRRDALGTMQVQFDERFINEGQDRQRRRARRPS